MTMSNNTQTIEAPAATKTTHVAFVLDRSGSMASCVDATIEGFNGQLDTILDNPTEGGETKVSLWTFDTAVREVFVAEPMDRIKKLDRQSYRPGGGTAMYDAVGDATIALEKLDRPGEDIAFLIIVVSDGYENSSQRFNAAMIANQVKRLEDTERWTFVYLGANQDLTVVAETLNLSAGNMVAYEATAEGTEAMYDRAKGTTDGYFKSVRSAGKCSTRDYSVL